MRRSTWQAPESRGPPECARIQRPRRWLSRTEPAPDGAHERHCPCQAEWWPYEFLLQQCIRGPDLGKTESGGTRRPASETAWLAAEVQAWIVCAAWRLRQPRLTGTDIELGVCRAWGKTISHLSSWR